MIRLGSNQATWSPQESAGITRPLLLCSAPNPSEPAAARSIGAVHAPAGLRRADGAAAGMKIGLTSIEPSFQGEPDHDTAERANQDQEPRRDGPLAMRLSWIGVVLGALCHRTLLDRVPIPFSFRENGATGNLPLHMGSRGMRLLWPERALQAGAARGTVRPRCAAGRPLALSHARLHLSRAARTAAWESVRPEVPRDVPGPASSAWSARSSAEHGRLAACKRRQGVAPLRAITLSQKLLSSRIQQKPQRFRGWDHSNNR